MEQTFESGKIGIERAFIHSLMKLGEEIIKEEFKDIINKLKVNIFENSENENNNNINSSQTNNELVNILNEKKKKTIKIKNISKFDFVNFWNFCKIFSREITKNLLLKEELLDETIISIDKVIDFESEKIHKFLEQILQSQLEFILNKITEELVDFVEI
jgi:Glu-tRNA(Gln) amidotransferase subunit E-like FAD-binding protein